MSRHEIANLFGNSSSSKLGRRAKLARSMWGPKRFSRPLSFDCLENRLMLAGVLGSAQDFAVLGHTTVTNTGPTVIFGSASTLANVGVFNNGDAGDAATGFSSAGNTFVGPGGHTNGPGLVNAPASIHLGDAVANLARNDLFTAYNALSSYGTATNLTGHDLGTSGTLPISSLVAGVYSFDTTAQLNGVLQLDAQGTDGGVWVFQIGSSLTTASASAVQLINPGGNLGSDVGVYWVVGSSATLGTSTAFEGNILANTSITLNTGATIYNGRALAETGAVTLDTNIISNICPPESSSPNSGPGFSGGLEFDDNGELAPIYRYSMAWEKRDAGGDLLGGAQFTITPNPLSGNGTLVILDNGPGDDNPTLGQILVNDVAGGSYTVKETVAPLGYVIDGVASRSIIVSGLDLNASIGEQDFNDPGVTNESDFHNSLIGSPVGSIEWEKRDAGGVLLGGAQFTIDLDPTAGVNLLTILDNGPLDANPADGQLLLRNVPPGEYTITETVAPLGYLVDVDPTRVVTVTLGDLTQIIGVQGINDPGVTNESDFHNSLIGSPVGSVAWEKRDGDGVLLGGAQFTIDLDPTAGVNLLTILDNGPLDANPADGQLLLINVLPGEYTITETVPPFGYVLDVDPTRVVNVTLGDLIQVIGVQGTNDPGVTDESDFHNQKRNVIVIGPGKSPITPEIVRVIDEATGAVLTQFAPYGNSFQGGVRVATGDLTGDGVAEIVTASGWSIVAQVRVYDQNGDLLTSFLPYGSTFNGGVQIAVADVTGDGLNDIITVPSSGPAEVKVFENILVGGVPTFDALHPYRDFLAFPSSFIGGAVVTAADMGSNSGPGGSFVNTLDQRAEIVVGSGAGMKATVKVFDVSGLTVLTPTAMPAAARSFTPFSTATTTYKGGVSLSAARINADLVPDIVVGAGVLGKSQVDVWAWSNTPSATLSSLSANGSGFLAFTDASRNSPVEVAALDRDGDGIADAILTAQGPGGTTNQIREFNITSVSPLQVSLPTVIPGSYLGPYFIAAVPLPTVNPMARGLINGPSPSKFHGVDDANSNRRTQYVAGESVENATPQDIAELPLKSLAGGGRIDLRDPLDVNSDGIVSPLDALRVINWLNKASTPGLGEPLGNQQLVLDVNNDGVVSPLDALLIINRLNSSQNFYGAKTESEGEDVSLASDAFFNQLGSVLTGEDERQTGKQGTHRSVSSTVSRVRNR